MAYRAYRPESANFRKIARPRSGLGTSEIEQALNFDPWQSVYKQNYTNGRPDSAKAQNPTFNNELSVKQRPETGMISGRISYTARVSRMSIKKTNDIIEKENARPNIEPNKNDASKRFESKDNQKNLAALKLANQALANMIANGPVISKVDPKSNAQIDCKSGTRSDLFETNTENKVMSKTETTDISKHSSLCKKTRSLTAVFDINVIGQQEKWIDPADALNPAPHSRLINFDRNNLLAANLKTLVLSANEYYPFLTGKCMCGECECGHCKCVHFKYKPSNANPTDNFMTTMYKEDFVPYPLQASKNRPVYNELHSCPSKVDYSSIYKKDYSGKSPFPCEETRGLNKAKEINIGVGDCNVKGPVNKETKYKLDYPDWKCSKTEPIKPFNPQTVPKDLPFFSKPHNNEYGNFYEQGEVPGVERAPNKLHQKTS